MALADSCHGPSSLKVSSLLHCKFYAYLHTERQTRKTFLFFTFFKHVSSRSWSKSVTSCPGTRLSWRSQNGLLWFFVLLFATISVTTKKSTYFSPFYFLDIGKGHLPALVSLLFHFHASAHKKRDFFSISKRGIRIRKRVFLPLLPSSRNFLSFSALPTQGGEEEEEEGGISPLQKSPLSAT